MDITEKMIAHDNEEKLTPKEELERIFKEIKAKLENKKKQKKKVKKKAKLEKDLFINKINRNIVY